MPLLPMHASRCALSSTCALVAVVFVLVFFTPAVGQPVDFTLLLAFKRRRLLVGKQGSTHQCSCPNSINNAHERQEKRREEKRREEKRREEKRREEKRRGEVQKCTDKQTDKQTDTQTHTQTHTHTDTQSSNGNPHARNSQRQHGQGM